jgi:CubicO group peptidase (beta-lactamase class C family)
MITQISHLKNQIILFFLLTSISVFAQTSDEAKLREIESYIRQAQKDWNVPGCAVAIVKNDSVWLEKGYGVREMGKETPVDEHTLFAIASLSKAFTSASLAMLVDEGKLKWDDAVIKHLPDFQMYDPWVTREMQVRDLLSHRSGLATFGGDLIWYWTKYDRKEVLRRVCYLKPISSFRTTYGYQNIMFVAAGEILPSVTGKSWEAFVRERIFQPLGMTRTNTSLAELMATDNIAVPHNEYQNKLRIVKHFPNEELGPAGAINSSAHDMAQWMRLQLGRGTINGKELFSKQAARTMWTVHTPLGVSEISEKNFPSIHFQGYGLGWGTSDYEGRKLLSHSGAIDGMISRIILCPEESLGVVVLTNSETSLSSIIARKVIDVFFGVSKIDWNARNLEDKRVNDSLKIEEEKKLDSSRVKGTKPSLALEKYAGTYSGELYGDVTVSVENKKLVVTFNPTENLVADLEHWHFDTFRATVRPMNYPFGKGFAQFLLDAKGNVTELKIDIPNFDFDFKELELKKVEKKN